MLALFVMLTHVTYQTRTRQNPRMVMSLLLGISQYLGGPRYELSCEIYESFQDSPHFTTPHVRHGSEFLLSIFEVIDVFSSIVEFQRRSMKIMPYVSTQPSHDTSKKSTPRHIASTSTSAKHQKIEVMQADPRQPCRPLHDVTAKVNLPEACPRNWYA